MSKTSIIFSFKSCPFRPKYNLSGWEIISSTVWLGFKDSSGFWKINWIALKKVESLCLKSLDNILSLSNLILPSLVFNSPAIDFKIVDLPLPDSPTSARVSPLSILILISFTVGLSSLILFNNCSRNFCFA